MEHHLCLKAYSLPKFLDWVSQELGGYILLVDGTVRAVGSVVVVLLPARQSIAFIRIHAVLCVPRIVACPPRNICSMKDIFKTGLHIIKAVKICLLIEGVSFEIKYDKK